MSKDIRKVKSKQTIIEQLSKQLLMYRPAADQNWQFVIVQTDHGVGVARRKDNATTIDYNGESSWEFFRDNWKKLPIVSVAQFKILIEDKN